MRRALTEEEPATVPWRSRLLDPPPLLLPPLPRSHRLRWLPASVAALVLLAGAAVALAILPYR